MQENAVGWDPVNIWHPVPWFVKIYLFYVLYVIVRCALRVAVCARSMSRENTPTALARIQIQFAALKRTVIITILGASVVGLFGVVNVLNSLGVERVHASGTVAAALAEAITPVAIGFVVALALYIATALLESRSEHRASS